MMVPCCQYYVVRFACGQNLEGHGVSVPSFYSLMKTSDGTFASDLAAYPTGKRHKLFTILLLHLL